MSRQRCSHVHVGMTCSRRSFLRTAAVATAAPAAFLSASGQARALDPVPIPPDLVFESARTLASLIRKKKVSPVELLEQHLARIAQVEPEIQVIEHLADILPA